MNNVQEIQPPKKRPEACKRVKAVVDVKKVRWREGPATPKGMKRASNAAVSRHDNVAIRSTVQQP